MNEQKIKKIDKMLEMTELFHSSELEFLCEMRFKFLINQVTRKDEYILQLLENIYDRKETSEKRN